MTRQPVPHWLLVFLLALGAVGSDAAQAEAQDRNLLESFAKWTKVEVQLHGPDSQSGGNPNPFATSLDVEFKSASGRTYRVPGFYDGDGQGHPDGNVWKARFAADETGHWSFVTRSDHPLLNGHRGAFEIHEPAKDAPDFYRWGRLEATGNNEHGRRYLKFRDGPYWLKAGCDDPENFLGRYSHYDSLEKRKQAVDYLAQRGINCLYIMTNNIDGDDKDVWPWLGNSPREAKSNSGENSRFDVAKLAEWRALFEYMQQRGVVVYLVLEDDSAWKQYDHARYYRELIARFGDLPALIFNFNEEYNENYRLPQALDFMRQLAEADPYGHPRGIHNVNAPNNDYIDSPYVHFTAIQTGSPGGNHPGAISHHRLTLDWLKACQSRGRTNLMIGFDEGRPEQNRTAWWSAYLAGGVWEAHILPPYDRPMSAWEPVWTELGGARAFMESMPFWEMQPHNELVTKGDAFCLAQPGKVYALYLPSGGTITLQLDNHSYDVQWWNPRNGRDGKWEHQQHVQGGAVPLTAPANGDWALRAMRRDALKN